MECFQMGFKGAGRSARKHLQGAAPIFPPAVLGPLGLSAPQVVGQAWQRVRRGLGGWLIRLRFSSSNPIPVFLLYLLDPVFPNA